MANIGKITIDQNQRLTGYINTLQLSLGFDLRLNSNATNPAAPTYLIVTQNNQGQDIQVGGAWKKTSNKKPGEGPYEFLSLTFDDPSFPQPLNVAGFPNEEGGYDISYRRRQEKKAA